MTAPQLTFERREVKYLLTDAERAELLARVSSHLVGDEHGASTVRSLYYDTPTLILARRSSEHPAYKEKLRLRAYGMPAPEETVFVELKKKCDGVVYKRRSTRSLAEAQGLLAGNVAAKGQIERELACAAGRYEGLAPACYLAYDREALYERGNRDLRLTFDRRVRMSWEAPRLDAELYGGAEQILDEGISILEIKTSRAMPLWLTQAMGELNLRQASWSKYGTAAKLRTQRSTHA